MAISDEKLYKHLIDSIHDPIILVDNHNKIVFANTAYLKSRGMENVNYVGHDIREFRPAEILSKVVESGIPVHNLYRKMNKVKFVVNVNPLKDNDGNILGAFAISKDFDEVRELANKTTEIETFVCNNEHPHFYGNSEFIFNDIITEDEIFKKAIANAKKIAKTDCCVLIMGESGTGKELLAHSIHSASNRYLQSFVAVNCAAIPDNLLESELFGYESGAFTGARNKGKLGLFEVADRGTLFLDEIGDMCLSTQGKLLRVLQDQKIRRVGGVKEVHIDVRIIAATNKNLDELVSQGNFREDLFYRLNEIPFIIPPLRLRAGDVPILAKYFVTKHNKKFNKHFSITSEAMETLIKYHWPGNVRQLKNSIKYATSISPCEWITNDDWPDYLICYEPPKGNRYETENIKKLDNIIKETEKKVILDSLTAYGNSAEAKKEIAEMLGIGLSTLYKKIDEYKLNNNNLQLSRPK